MDIHAPTCPVDTHIPRLVDGLAPGPVNDDCPRDEHVYTGDDGPQDPVHEGHVPPGQAQQRARERGLAPRQRREHEGAGDVVEEDYRRASAIICRGRGVRLASYSKGKLQGSQYGVE